MRVCAVCGTALVDGGVGRPTKYCSGACRQRAFRRRSPKAPAGEPLPRALDGFVGRELELPRVRSLLRSARLVTVVGPGGVGKTRLATEVVHGLRGARLAELDSVGRGELVPQALAAALGMRERAETDLREALLAELREREVLLLLDNCEHVIDSCASLVEWLLRRCPGLRVLATSREALRVPGEVVFRLGQLSVPEVEDDLALVLRSDAARLFVERARGSDPAFVPEPAGVLAEVCRRLDGLPLAIELAARRAGALSLPEILAGLDDQLALLTDGSRTAPPRHRELAAAIEWSHRVLEPAERAVFRRLSVLLGGFDMSGAIAVCGEDSATVRRLVCALEAKSLIVRNGDRFRQLNPIRVYAAERLAESGELAATRDRAASWLAGLAGSPVGPLFFGDSLAEGVRDEHENLIAAVEHTAGDRDDRHVLLAMALASVWQQRELPAPARELLAATLDRVPVSEYRGMALAMAARFACFQLDRSVGLSLARQAVEAQRGREDPIALVDALDTLALALLVCDEGPAAVAVYRECLELVRPLGRVAETAFCEYTVAWALFRVGDVVGAEEMLAKCLPVLREHGSPAQLAAALQTAGALRLELSDVDGSERFFVEALDVVPIDSSHMAPTIEGLAFVAVRRGDLTRALTLGAAAASIRDRLDIPAEGPWQEKLDASLALAQDRLTATAARSAIAAGESLHGARLTAFLLRDKETRAVEHPLTPREAEVARLVAEGLTNPEIAKRLRVSGGTVAAHLNRIRDKLGLRSRTRIALWVAERFRNA
ncbi:LuxR C-terminal-related transcriptional regulator [Allokutzneria sp. A3M-2-11 16]|uniref:ATP-binding protein n=1 Tax=Allokutzneria sp. A3M-2-11 16 TaxID=2962043 RepID=UPI0020B89138|nr:LuxR C-terminal-related transcriptional regulator [Allokutzneria sp. A3M-2-11 16]MCP3797814.1 LuxR C-terminal-related transcriptional regulator [Allokutzneria sp. A3M-2-11 16]